MKVRALIGVAVAVSVWLIGTGAAWGNSLTPLCTIDNGPTQPCTTGWYQTPVFVSWTWSPYNTGSGSCPTGPYDVDTVTRLTCVVTWTDQTQQSYTLPLHVEVSTPTVTATTSRPPDSNGWYNHAVTAALSASSFSGIAYCSPTTYNGAATTTATVSGTCVDNAGKSVSATSAPFAYDPTPPSLTATATTGDRSVTLAWQAGGDIAPITSFDVVRNAGSSDAPHVVYSGPFNAYQDTGVSDGVQYTYTITAHDAAGNASTQTVVATPEARLLAPINAVHLAAPPMLSWTPIRGATYYNVQLFSGAHHKVLSIWPIHASLQLRRTWKFEGRRYRLKPGRYRWYVWPGFGKRRAAHYGHVIGSGTFVIVR